MNTSAVRRLLAAGLVAAALGVVAPTGASAAPVQLAPAAAADAYALDVDATLVAGNIPVDAGPEARATQEYPPGAQAPAENEVFGTGEIPSGGALVKQVGLLTSMAAANATPQAVASAQAVDVRLLTQAGVPMITADLIRAQSNTDCVNDPNANGTEFVNLRVAGQTDPIPTPAPNTELAPALFNPLGLKVVLNEQHPTFDGRGLVVNAIHIYAFKPASVPVVLFDGDIVVSHAMSTVNCPNGKGTTGGSSVVSIVKNADKAAAKPGDTVTYTATVQNKSTQACAVNRLIEHLPSPFELVSTSGDFGTAFESESRPGGGVDVIVRPENVSIAAGASLTQTFVTKVKDDAAPGVYFNNVELFCANLGNFVKGLDAPVEITTTTVDLPECSDTLDNDGDGKIDFPNDPGCDSPQDDDERDSPAPLPRTGDPRGTFVLLGVSLLAAAALVRRKALSL